MAPFSAIEVPNQVTLKSTSWIEGKCLAVVDESCSHCDSSDAKPAPLAAEVHTSEERVTPGKRKVTFSDSIEIKEIPHLSQIDIDDKVASWWTSNDYLLIRKMFTMTIKLMLEGETFHNDDEDLCARGLEFGTNGRSRRHNHVARAVLDAQEFQRYEGFFDPDYIAEIYAEYSQSSFSEARCLGLADQTAAQASS